MRRFIKTLTITTIAVGLVAGTVLAASNTTEVKKFEGENRSERPEKPENEVFGKITSIDANTITVTLAEMKKPEGRTNPPERNNRDDKNKDNNSREDRPEINMDDMFTLTSTIKTYNISNADLIKFKKQELDKNDNANNSSNKDTNKDDRKKRTLEELEKDSKATYTDFAVGDYVSIELESSTSTTAKKVKSMDKMGDGFRMRKFYNQNGNNNNKNSIK